MRNLRLLTKNKLNHYFSQNEMLNSIFNHTDPDIIAEIIIRELSIIIECIAPSKLVQCDSKHAPWIDQNFKNESKFKDELHKIAKKSNNEDDWRAFRLQRNLVNKINKDNKNRYYNFQLNINKNSEIDSETEVRVKKMWKTIKILTATNKQVPPRVISYGGELVTSVKKICNIANEHFIAKISKIRDKFSKNPMVTPIQILSRLIPRNTNEINLLPATIEQVNGIIKKAKPKNSTGSNIISMIIIKKLSPSIDPHLTHLINAIY